MMFEDSCSALSATVVVTESESETCSSSCTTGDIIAQSVVDKKRKVELPDKTDIYKSDSTKFQGTLLLEDNESASRSSSDLSSLLIREPLLQSEVVTSHFVCVVCFSFFMSWIDLMTHHSKGHSYFSCLSCNLVFLDEKEFRNHLRNIHKEYRCKFCALKFDNREQFKEHQGVTIECIVCNGKFRDVDELDLHISSFHRCYKRCRVCLTTAKSMSELLNHFNQNHHATCSACCTQFSSVEEVEAHHKRGHDNFYKCEGCNMWFVSEEKLLAHGKHAHCSSKCRAVNLYDSFTKRNIDSLLLFNINLMCVECHNQIFSLADLNHHSKTHLIYQCLLCRDRYKHKQNSWCHSCYIVTKQNKRLYNVGLNITLVDESKNETHCPLDSVNKHDQPQTRYRCLFCKKSFTVEYFIQHHCKETIKLMPLMACLICKEVICDDASYRAHKLIHSKFKCIKFVSAPDDASESEPHESTCITDSQGTKLLPDPNTRVEVVQNKNGRIEMCDQPDKCMPLTISTFPMYPITDEEMVNETLKTDLMPEASTTKCERENNCRSVTINNSPMDFVSNYNIETTNHILNADPNPQVQSTESAQQNTQEPVDIDNLPTNLLMYGGTTQETVHTDMESEVQSEGSVQQNPVAVGQSPVYLIMNNFVETRSETTQTDPKLQVQSVGSLQQTPVSMDQSPVYLIMNNNTEMVNGILNSAYNPQLQSVLGVKQNKYRPIVCKMPSMARNGTGMAIETLTDPKLWAQRKVRVQENMIRQKSSTMSPLTNDIKVANEGKVIGQQKKIRQRSSKKLLMTNSDTEIVYETPTGPKPQIWNNVSVQQKTIRQRFSKISPLTNDDMEIIYETPTGPKPQIQDKVSVQQKTMKQRSSKTSPITNNDTEVIYETPTGLKPQIRDRVSVQQKTIRQRFSKIMPVTNNEIKYGTAAGLNPQTWGKERVQQKKISWRYSKMSLITKKNIKVTCLIPQLQTTVSVQQNEYRPVPSNISSMDLIVDNDIEMANETLTTDTQQRVQSAASVLQNECSLIASNMPLSCPIINSRKGTCNKIRNTREQSFCTQPLKRGITNINVVESDVISLRQSIGRSFRESVNEVMPHDIQIESQSLRKSPDLHLHQNRVTKQPTNLRALKMPLDTTSTHDFFSRNREKTHQVCLPKELDLDSTIPSNDRVEHEAGNSRKISNVHATGKTDLAAMRLLRPVPFCDERKMWETVADKEMHTSPNAGNEILAEKTVVNEGMHAITHVKNEMLANHDLNVTVINVDHLGNAKKGKISNLDLECNLCSFGAIDEESLQEHFLSQHKVLPSKCCGNVFTSLKAFQKHNRAHLKYVCPVCSYVLGSIGTRFQKPCVCAHCWNHLRVNDIKSAYVTECFKCLPCSFIFATKQALFKHHTQTHAVWRCNLCHLECYTKINLKLHLKAHMLKCFMCKYTCETASKLAKHVEKHKRFMCPVCFISFDSLEQVEHHKKYAHLQCFACNYFFKDQSELMKHNIYYHKQTSAVSVSCKPANVLICDTKLVKRDGALYSFTIDGKVKCKICGLKLDTEKDFEAHTQSHDERYQCNICFKQFRCNKDLQSHHKIHFPTYFCNVCNKVSATRSEFETHKLSHSMTKCQFCARTFATRKELSNHQWNACSNKMGYPVRSSKNASGKSCNIGNVTLVDPVSLANRRTEVHVKWMCGQCGLHCYSNRELENHVLVHTTTLRRSTRLLKETNSIQENSDSLTESTCAPLMCQLCSYSSSSFKNLQEHLSKIHPQATDCAICEMRFDNADGCRKHCIEIHF